MSFEERFLGGIAMAVAENPTAQVEVEYNLVDPYGASEFGIYFTGRTTLGDRAVVIRLYAVDESVSDNDAVIGVQFEIRSPDLRQVQGITDDLRALFHRAWGVTLGGVEVSNSFRRSGTGSDDGGRVTRTENYYMTVNRP